MIIRLGYDTYSLRALRWNANGTPGFCCKQGLDAIQFSATEDYGDVSPKAFACAGHAPRNWAFALIAA